jgi:F-type H+-transporting ATPase subunit delta
LVKEDQGIIEARLITARETDQKLLEQIRQELEKTTGKKVEMKKEIDPRLIGGMVIIVGDRVIDRSVRCQLNLLKDQMSALKVHESA